jgi:hypothetical protein
MGPVNEPVRSYAPGTPERASLKARLATMAAEMKLPGNATLATVPEGPRQAFTQEVAARILPRFPDGFPLKVRPDEPPTHHAAVIQWPPVTDPDARKSLAQQLRAKSQAYPHPKLAIR